MRAAGPSANGSAIKLESELSAAHVTEAHVEPAAVNGVHHTADSQPADAGQSNPELPVGAAVPHTPDGIMDACLMAGLHLVPDSELPLLTSTFYAKYMLQGKPAGRAPATCCSYALPDTFECHTAINTCLA